MNLDDAVQTFIVESRELLQQMEEALLLVEQQPANAETVNAIFRAAHTIKGSAGLFGFDAIVAFTHHAESVLDRVRGQGLPLDGPLTALLLEVGDQLRGMVDRVARGEAASAEDDARGQQLTARLQTYLGGAEQQIVVDAGQRGVAASPVVVGSPVAARHWHVSLRCGPELLRHGMDPMAVFHYLASLGQITHLETRVESLPSLGDMDAERCYLGFELAFLTEAAADLVIGAFDFVREDSEITLLPPGAPLADYQALVATRPEGLAQMLESLLACGSLTEDEAATIRLGSNPGAAEADAPPAAPGGVGPVGKEGAPRENRSLEAQLIRVDASKLDLLINLVGELIIAGAGAGQLARARGVPDLVEANGLVSRLVEAVRDTALNLRMVQIGATFNRFRRVVRDVAAELGKDIQLDIQGGDTELDKTVVEKIGDPLTHIVRNAMDHGIEPAAVRIAQGKPAHGTVRLNAYHESGSIVIEVSDDGGGLNREKILRKARERGVIGENQGLSEKEIFNLVFEAGFSTAEAVSKLSGRGVGMDVVKQNITALRGSVDLMSVEGEGTTVRIRLPLTLAIIDGFLVGVGASVYVVPLDMVVECIEGGTPHRALDTRGGYLNLRGEVLPLIDLRRQFHLPALGEGRENVVVVSAGGQRAGLVVDRLLGEFQTVIKPLGPMFRQVRGIGGATILGSGEVALILDVPGLVGKTISLESMQFQAASWPVAA